MIIPSGSMSLGIYYMQKDSSLSIQGGVLNVVTYFFKPNSAARACQALSERSTTSILTQ